MKLSIIIAAYNIENFVEQALHSCLQADAQPFEVIVIDDCSTDRTAELVDRFIAMHGAGFDLHLVRKPANEGLGKARNTGMDHATGDFILFLDGDDWFPDGFLHEVRNVLTERDPDVLIFNHARVYGNGRVARNAESALLAEREVYDVDVRTRLIGNLGVAWNKVYRHSFLRDRGLRFETGLYEDISWSFPIILSAERLHTIPTVGVMYRQRTGSILRSSSADHFDVISQLKLLLDRTVADPAMARDYGAALYRHARRQVFFVQEQGRVPRDLQRRFTQQAYQMLFEWRQALQITSRDVSLSAYARAGYSGHLAVSAARAVMKPVKAVTRRVKGHAARIAAAVQRRSTMPLYRLRCRYRPIEPKKVMLDAYWGAKADCNPLAIARALDRVGGYDLVWLLKSGVALPEGAPGRRVDRMSPRMFTEAATAKYFVSNVNFPTEFIKRKGTVHLQTFHGTPLKLMGLDIRPRNPREMDWDHYATRSLRWDYAISSNPHSSYAWRRSAPYHYKMLETGYPRNDIFFAATPEQRDQIRERLGVRPGTKVALYAPTMRDDHKGKSLPVAETIFSADAVAEALGPDYTLLVRAHYFLKGANVTTRRAVDVSAYQNSNEIALVTDLLITDYSSLMFDYACLRRPVVLYQYDYEDYLAKRGVYFDIRQAPPGPVVETLDDLLACLAARDFDSDAARAQIAAFADRFAPWDDGQATARVVKRVFGVDAPPQ